MRMADGKRQHDWDRSSFEAFWATAAYQDKRFTVYDIHPGYTEKAADKAKADGHIKNDEDAERMRKRFQNMRE